MELALTIALMTSVSGATRIFRSAFGLNLEMGYRGKESMASLLLGGFAYLTAKIMMLRTRTERRGFMTFRGLRRIRIQLRFSNAVLNIMSSQI